MKTTRVSRFASLTTAAILLLTALMLAGCSTTINGAITEKEQASESGVETLPVPQDGPLSLTITSGVGDVEVQGSDDSAVLIGYKKTAYAETRQEAQDELTQVTLDIQQADGAITIDTVQRGETTNRTNTVKLTITVPRDLTLSITQNVGKVTVRDLNAAGVLAISTDVGDIDLEAVQTPAGMNLSTGVGGISFDGVLGPHGHYELVTSTGDVAVRLPQNTDADIDARTDVGDIKTSGLTLSNHHHSKEVVQETLAATLGSGGPVLRLRTGVGSISVARS